MFKFVAFGLWVCLVCLLSLYDPNYWDMSEIERICFDFEGTIFTTFFYAANLIYTISYWFYFLNKSLDGSLFIMSIFITLWTILFGFYGWCEGYDGPGFCILRMGKHFFKYGCDRKMEKFSYKFVKQFYTLHPENFHLTGDKFFTCGFIYHDKDSSAREEVFFRMSVISYIRFIFFVKRHRQKKEEPENNKNKKLRDAMISLLEEDRKRIAEDKAQEQEKFLAAMKNSEVIIARLEKE